MSEFTLDTSGCVRLRAKDAPWKGLPKPDVYWSDLDPFTQGYIEALFASLQRFYWLRCPDCEWDCITLTPSVGDLGICCPLCAGDNGRDVPLRTVDAPLPATVEGVDSRESARGFSDIAPETLERIMGDCRAYENAQKHLRVWSPEKEGRCFWDDRQHARPLARGFPPLTPTLGDDGKVYLTEAAGAA